MSTSKTRILTFLKRDPALVAAAVCAVLSMFFVPPSSAYFTYLDLRVLSLLFSLMLVIAGFQKCGLFTVLSERLLRGSKTLRLLVWLLVMLPFFSSMLITNDVALLTFVPFAILILGMVERRDILMLVVVLQTVAANLGSMLTPIGNPQNLFLYGKFEMGLDSFFLTLLPIVAISFFALSAAAFAVGRQSIEVSFPKQEALDRRSTALFLLLFVLCLLSVFRILPYWSALLAVAVGTFFCDRSLFRRADYALLLTFVCFFLFTGNIGRIPEVQRFLAGLMEQGALFVSALASQLISNVPAAVLLSGFTDDWRGLLLGVNIGGLGTPVASLASLISLKFFLRQQPDGLRRYLLLFSAVNFAGLLLLSLVAWWLLL